MKYNKSIQLGLQLYEIYCLIAAIKLLIAWSNKKKNFPQLKRYDVYCNGGVTKLENIHIQKD